MISIHKNNEPNELLRYRQQTGASFQDMDRNSKDALKQSLLNEQGFICCYCMSRITEDNMKIEHWLSQSNHPSDGLAYQNLLAACNGNEGQPHRNQHCDTKKGYQDIKYNPANINHRIEGFIRYLDDGTIESEDVEFSNQLDTVLNLNFSRLKSNRKNVIDAVHEVLNAHSGTRTSNEIQSLINRWNTSDKNGLKEYCGVAINFLEKKLNRT